MRIGLATGCRLCLIGVVEVGDPRIESVLSRGEVGERRAVAEKFSAQAAMPIP